MKPQVTGAKLAVGWPNENASHVRDEICMSHPKLSFPHLTSLKMYRSIWKAFFLIIFFMPCLSTCFCLFKYL